MPRTSAGILMYRRRHDAIEVLLVHPGGPFWKNKDAGAWSIPKGEQNADEDLLMTAKREFAEEIGTAPTGEFIQLTPIKQKAGKIVHAWAVAGDVDTAAIHSNTMRVQWSPRSGKWIQIPEVDRAEFFDVATAKTKINPAQAAFIDELIEKLS